MRLRMPDVKVPNDSISSIMARRGIAFATTGEKTVWYFGFLPGSDLAKAFGVHVDNGLLWVLADRHGKILKEFTGMYWEVEKEKAFQDIFDG